MKKQNFLVSFEYEFINENINAEPLNTEQVTKIISTFLSSKSNNIKNLTLIEKTKKEHEILHEHLIEKYNKEELKGNVARIINKTTPQNPDKSNR